MKHKKLPDKIRRDLEELPGHLLTLKEGYILKYRGIMMWRGASGYWVVFYNHFRVYRTTKEVVAVVREELRRRQKKGDA